MGRPLNKKHFGTGAGEDLKVRAKIGSAVEGVGSVVRQRGSARFEVTVGADTSVCKLVDKVPGSLAAGEMTLSARNTGGTVKRIVKITGKKATLNDGAVVSWNFAAATGGKVEIEEEGDTFSTPVITITAQPTSATVTAPTTVTYSVVASVAPSATLTYQWRKNGTNISGATSASYTTPATTQGETGTFTVVVSVVGATSVTSNGATLTVN